MARPVATRLKGPRVQVEQPTANPGLDVTASMNVDTGPSAQAQGWAQLQNALGLVGQAYSGYKAKEDAKALEQGQADQQFGRVDQERLQREQKYADGVEQAHVVTQTNDAIARVEERASKELPVNATVEEKMHWVDAQLGVELGTLAEDPKARLIIHQQVADYMEKFAGREVAVNRAQNQDAVREAWTVDVNRAIEGGHADIPALVAHGAEVLGGSAPAWQQMIDIIANRAEETHDPTVLDDLIPTRIEGEAGVEQPALSKVNKERILLARQRIDKYVEEKGKPAREWQQAKVLDLFNGRIRDGLPIGMAETEPYVLSGVLTGDQAASLRDQSLNEVTKRQKKAEALAAQQQVFDMAGGKSWIDTEGLIGGSKNRSESQDLTDTSIQRLITGYAVHNNIDQPPTSGRALMQHPELLTSVLASSNQFRLPYGPLKSYLDEVTPTMGSTVIERLPAYERAKALGVESMYVTPEQQAVYEQALSLRQAGEKPEEVVKHLQQSDDPAVKKYVAENRQKAYTAVMGKSIDVRNSIFDTSGGTVSNSPYVEAKLKALSDVYLQRGKSPSEAATLAYQRFTDTHFAVKVNGAAIVLPESPAYDSAAAQTALEEFSKLAPQLATKHGDPHPDKATITVPFARNGQDTVVHIVGSDGLELTAPMSIPAMIEQMKKTKANAYQEAVRINREALQKRRERARMGGGNPTLIIPGMAPGVPNPQ